LVRTLQDNGICVLGSSIIGLEEHTPENIDAAIDYAVSHATEFHQFMLYSASHGTPLHEELSAQGKILGPDEIQECDAHGQWRFNYRHPHIPAGAETEMLLRAFQRDFDVNGPSVLRIVRTILNGRRKYRTHVEKRVRRRFAHDIGGFITTFPGALWASRKWFKAKGKYAAAGKLNATLRELYHEFGLRARLMAPIVGSILGITIRREEARLAAGWTWEPPTYYECNGEALAGHLGASICKIVSF
jgi:hypothetical protein